jgi:hypothetical protein
MSKSLIGLVLFVLVAVLAVFVARRPANPSASDVATLKSAPLRMTFADGALYWLETEGRSLIPSRLMQLRLGSAARALVEKAKLRSFAVAGQDVYFTEEDASSVKRISAQGGQPSEVIRNAQNPGEVFADEQHLYWTETAPATLAFVAHVPVANYVTTIHQSSRDGGSPRVLARVESATPTFQGRLLGREQNSFYWAEWTEEGQGSPTTALRKATDRGDAVLLSLNAGRRNYLRQGGFLYGTAWSDAASPPARYVAVKRIALSGGEETTLTDWLESGGALMSHSNGVYYLQRNGVWMVPSTWQPSETAVKVDAVEKCCYLHDGLLFAYIAPMGDQPGVLRQRAFKPRNALMRFFGLGQ